MRLTGAVAVLLVLFACLLAPIRTRAENSIYGLWLVPDGDGVIQTYPCGQDLCGRIAGVTAPAGQTTATAPSKSGRPLCDLPILIASRSAGDQRWNGTIDDPDDGTRWTCQVWLDADGLHLRGYVLTPLLGQTQVWKPFTGHIGPDCAILH